MNAPTLVEVLPVVCAWCQKPLNDVPVTDPAKVSHGICPICAAAELAKLGGAS